MKTIVLLSCMLAAVAADQYSDKYDNIDLDEIISNKRLLTGYTNCILDKGKCTAEGKELREHIEDALETGCSKCTEAQDRGSTKVIDHLIKHESEIWHELTAKYDPEGKYKKQYEEKAKAKGIIIPE